MMKSGGNRMDMKMCVMADGMKEAEGMGKRIEIFDYFCLPLWIKDDNLLFSNKLIEKQKINKQPPPAIVIQHPPMSV